jgi:predicted DCC family thiol-disulfide oxidoreductase YuxK
VLIEGGHCYTRSNSVLRIVKHLSGLWPLLYAGIVLPLPLRDALYNWISRNRYRWFGRKDSCMMPTPELRRRFLDEG